MATCKDASQLPGVWCLQRKWCFLACSVSLQFSFQSWCKYFEQLMSTCPGCNIPGFDVPSFDREPILLLFYPPDQCQSSRSSIYLHCKIRVLKDRDVTC